MNTTHTITNPRILVSGDYSAFAHGWNSAGVYMISGLQPSQTFDQPVYVGSSQNLKARTANNLYTLAYGEHSNKPLQAYYDEHGVENLVIFCVEPCPPDVTKEREQAYLDALRPFAQEFRGFNIATNAASPNKGKKLTSETKRKIAAVLKGKTHTEETKAKMSASHAKPFSLKSPAGKLVKGKNLNQFAKLNGLDVSNLWKVLHGKFTQSKGWTRAQD